MSGPADNVPGSVGDGLFDKVVAVAGRADECDKDVARSDKAGIHTDVGSVAAGYEVNEFSQSHDRPYIESFVPLYGGVGVVQEASCAAKEKVAHPWNGFAALYKITGQQGDGERVFLVENCFVHV